MEMRESCVVPLKRLKYPAHKHCGQDSTGLLLQPQAETNLYDKTLCLVQRTFHPSCYSLPIIQIKKIINIAAWLKCLLLVTLNDFQNFTSAWQTQFSKGVPESNIFLGLTIKPNCLGERTYYYLQYLKTKNNLRLLEQLKVLYVNSFTQGHILFPVRFLQHVHVRLFNTP